MCPMYEYLCPSCSFSGELIVDLYEERDAQLCPLCKRKLARQLSLTNFVLKGGGWSSDGYATLIGDSPRHKELARVAKVQKQQNDKAGGRT